ncbi:hypothetical protein [Acinetobacter zhairhuonensis]|uniref:hypothetical protein n=1 Tax=Acinetobacter sp. A7.4 TaxID=2919921 RepID=UPI001F4F44BA|nr:hypothetical protein [Acinetobacter sp. A7.4]MCJ8162841.1 hypothetical protein [Acinetobacter sp. A7.4]
MNVLEKAQLAKELQSLIYGLDQRALSFFEIAKSKSRLKEIFLSCDEPIFKKQILNFKCQMQPELTAHEFANQSMYAKSFRGVFLTDHELERTLEQHSEMGWAILYQADLGYQIWYIPAPRRAALISDWDGLEQNYEWMLEQQEIYHGLKTDAELSVEAVENTKSFKMSKKRIANSTPQHRISEFSNAVLSEQTQQTPFSPDSAGKTQLLPQTEHSHRLQHQSKPAVTSADIRSLLNTTDPKQILPQVVELGQWKCRLTALQFPQAQEYKLCCLTVENVPELMPLLELMISASALEQYVNQPVYLAEQVNAQGRFVKYLAILGAEDQLHAIRLGNVVSQHYAYEISALKLLPNEQKLKQCKTTEQLFELYHEQAQLVWNTENYHPFIPAKCVQKQKFIAFDESPANYATPLILLKERQKIRIIHGHARLQLSHEDIAYPFILLDRNQGVSWQLIQSIIQTLPQPISASKLHDAIEKHISS